MYSETEKQLVLRAQAGDEQAYQLLYEKYYPYVYHYAYHLCKNEADAKDVVQDVFMELYRSLVKLRNADYFMLWLKRVTKSKAQLLFRRNKDAVLDPEVIVQELGSDARTDHSPHLVFDNHIEEHVMRSLAAQLSKRRREVVEMFYFEQLSIEEIAKRLDLNINTVKSRLHMARKELNLLAADYENREGRKISFHVDQLLPGFVVAFLYKCKNMLEHSKVLAGLQVGMVSACVVIGGSALLETYSAYEGQERMAAEAKADDTSKEMMNFAPLHYRDKQVNSANDAYFILMSFASDKEILEIKSKEELAEIAPIVASLRKEDNYYQEVLEERGWFSAYDTLMRP
ncbi:MAG: sigma-70 family RNA polymerase sigma factor [Erysipelotrichaceae bacterium]|nr:sigma-70 family RNA polymerase sigma factor [Erysipelotrichaceae bacterium]